MNIILFFSIGFTIGTFCLIPYLIYARQKYTRERTALIVNANNLELLFNQEFADIRVEELSQTEYGKRLLNQGIEYPLRVKNLGFNGNKSSPILSNINFEVRRGETLGILGPNGSGKTTLLKIIKGDLIPSSGEILINNHQISNSQKERYLSIGFIPGNVYIKNKKTTLIHHLRSIAERYQVENVAEYVNEILDLIDMFEYQDEPLENIPKSLVGLAEILVLQPPILLFDEPTAGLSINEKEKVLSVIKALTKNRTIIFTSHIFSETTQLCDEMLIMHHGKIIAQDTPINIQERLNSSANLSDSLFDTINEDNKVLVRKDIERK